MYKNNSVCIRNSRNHKRW